MRIVGARSAEQFDINIISILVEVIMYFKRKAYAKLVEWKKLYSEKYAVLLEGARRVGKSTIAETFAKNEYRSYLLIDFS